MAEAKVTSCCSSLTPYIEYSYRIRLSRTGIRLSAIGLKDLAVYLSIRTVNNICTRVFILLIHYQNMIRRDQHHKTSHVHVIAFTDTT